MKRLFLAFGLLIAGIISASATCTGPAVMHDFPGTSFNFSLGTAGDGGCKSLYDWDTSSQAHADSIAPLPLKALSSEPAAATTTNPVPAMADLAGKQVTSPYANRENMLRCAVTITASMAATTCTGMGAQGASVKIYITDLCITRGDAGTTAITATLNDSATSIVDLPNNGGGGGFCKSYNVPLVIAANTAFQITLGTSITSGHVTASGFSGY